MPRVPHGATISLEDIEKNNAASAADGGAFVKSSILTRFGYLFPELHKNPESLLEPSEETVEKLKHLGETMLDSGTGDEPGSDIPSVYTYFGQFLVHDLTFEAATKDVNVTASDLKPLPPSDVPEKIQNTRTGTLDLDSIYGKYCYALKDCRPVPRVDKRLLVQRAAKTPGFEIAGTTPDDVPRDRDYLKYPDRYGTAKIGDPRNDQNIIISQLHVAFLRAHNAIAESVSSFEEARTRLRRYCQRVVINDYLDRICDPVTLAKVRANPRRFYDPPDEGFYIPLEFSVAAFRFGHSMIRRAYDYNARFRGSSRPGLKDLLVYQVLDRYHNLPESWMIEWKNFVGDDAPNKARPIGTRIVSPLSKLVDEKGKPLQYARNLATRDLLRGYLLSLPTGQAVAKALGEHALSAAEVESVAADEQQAKSLQSSGFSGRTPLWFYILAEAAYYKKGRLGPTGTWLVASVLIGLVRRSADSILVPQSSSPEPPDEKFELRDLLRLAGVFK